jgi:hypothetical protein
MHSACTSQFYSENAQANFITKMHKPIMQPFKIVKSKIYGQMKNRTSIWQWMPSYILGSVSFNFRPLDRKHHTTAETMAAAATDPSTASSITSHDVPFFPPRGNLSTVSSHPLTPTRYH